MAVWVKSKRTTVEDGMPEGEEGEAELNAGVLGEEAGAKRHCSAAFRARLAKNWLEAGVSRPAEATEPSGLSCTRTLIRTVP